MLDDEGDGDSLIPFSMEARQKFENFATEIGRAQFTVRKCWHFEFQRSYHHSDTDTVTPSCCKLAWCVDIYNNTYVEQKEQKFCKKG